MLGGCGYTDGIGDMVGEVGGIWGLYNKSEALGAALGFNVLSTRPMGLSFGGCDVCLLACISS